jgi:XRE family transcriptional regulator, aerobic/anaerobic benzoate catabolism transcriptional regulator
MHHANRFEQMMQASEREETATQHALPETSAPDSTQGRDAALASLGDRVRMMRALKGISRKALSGSSGVSERHLANLESGVGNASFIVLKQVADALGCTVADLANDGPRSSPENILIHAVLNGRTEAELTRARVALCELFGEAGSQAARQRRIALVGLRGAGKSTLGQMLADELAVPFIELTREVERLAGCSLGEIQSLLGQSAYRRYEKRALDEVIQRHPDAVIATPGGIVSEPTTFKLLLSECLTVWLKASPDEHMQRVVTQGDFRPMAGNSEAMDDLKRILISRAAMYGKAALTWDTSGKSLADNFSGLLGLLRSERAVASPGGSERQEIMQNSA